MSNGPDFVSNPGIAISTTEPDEILFHKIHDHELKELGRLDAPVVGGFFFTFLGATLTSGFPFTDEPKQLLSISVLSYFYICLTATVITGMFFVKRVRLRNGMENRIRSRKKLSISMPPDRGT